MRTALILALTALAGCTQTSAPAPEAALPLPSGPDFENALTVSPRFDAEAQAVAIDLSLRPGFHVYTTGEKTGRPIRIELAEGAWSAKGEPSYPTGEKKTTALGTSVVVEGQATARLAVSADGEAPGLVQGSFHYQVCTDEACDRPRKKAFALTP